MNQQNHISIKFIGLVFFLSLVLSGCLDIAYDITPPPDDSQFAGETESAAPTLIPTLAIPPTPTLSTSEVWDGGVINVFVAAAVLRDVLKTQSLLKIRQLLME